MNRNKKTDMTDIRRQIENAQRREILIPFVLIAVSFGLFFAATVWLGFADPASLSRLSDSVATLFIILTTVALLAGFVLNTLIITQIDKLRRTLPLKLNAANDKIRDTETIILDALNNLTAPLIGLIANFNAVIRIFNRTRTRSASKDDPFSES